MILPTIRYSIHQNKVIFLIKLLNPRTWLSLKNSFVIFLASETYAASLTSAASKTLMASMTSKDLFPQKTSWFWWFHPHWHPNHQYWSLFGKWILKNPNFYWYLAIFLSEAVEASRRYFFENKLIKLKCPHLLKVLLPFIKLGIQLLLVIWDFKVCHIELEHPVEAKSTSEIPIGKAANFATS